MAIVNELMDRRHERSDIALLDLCGELVVESFMLGRSKLGRRKESAPELRERVVADYRAGASLDILAKVYKKPKATVHRWVTKAGARRSAVS
jgi:hypothetical protein